MRRVEAWVCGLFDHSWLHFCEYLIVLSACVAGVFLEWKWIGVTVLLLFLTSWGRWRELIAKAGKIDREYRQIGALALRASRFGIAAEMYAKSHLVAVVLGAKFSQDALFMAGAFVFGYISAWVWGVR